MESPAPLHGISGLDMFTTTTRTNHRKQQNDKQIDPIIAKLTGLVDDLDDALVDSLGRPDSRQVIQGIASAICVQELTRMMVTKIKMDAGIRSAVDSERVRCDWQALCRHYAGTKHARILDHGVTQLEKLSPEHAQEVIYTIRQSIAPSLNWAMEEKVVKIGLALPVVGKLGMGNLYFSLRGTRVAMRTLTGRLIRLSVQGVLWLAVAAGTVHWTSWTFFDEPYLASTFGSVANLVQFVLLISTTLVVWAFAKVRREDSAPRRGRGFRVVRFAAWSIVAAAWCHFLVWLLLGVSSEPTWSAPAAKLLLPFFLLSGGIAAWLSGRVFRGGEKDAE